jgi:hypothetical protein
LLVAFVVIRSLRDPFALPQCVDLGAANDLLPPEQRPKTFALGGRGYDPARLGFVVEAACGQQDCVVDTTRTGNGNGGHLWGTDLAEPDRWALLEYLKTY